MIGLQERLMGLSQYNVDFKFCGEWFLIGVEYKDGWQIVCPTNPLIEHMGKGGRYYYCAPTKDVSVDEVFDCIEETVEHNKDLEKKVELFKGKVGELQDIFATEDFQTLQTLEFKFKKPRKGKKVAKEETVEAEPVAETPVPNAGEAAVVGPTAEPAEDDGIYVDEGVKFVDTMKLDF